VKKYYIYWWDLKIDTSQKGRRILYCVDVNVRVGSDKKEEKITLSWLMIPVLIQDNLAGVIGCQSRCHLKTTPPW